MKISMKIEGGPQLAKALGLLPGRVGVTVQRKALRTGGELIRSRAASIAPRAPGAPDIADNIGMSAARSIDEKEVAIKVGPTRGFAYGLPLELGTRRSSARPFMRPAFDEMAPAALAAIKGELWRAIAALGGSRGSPSGGGLL